MKVPSWLTSSSGRRPRWSDHRPSIGPAINWHRRVSGDQQAHHGRRRAEFFRIERQQRQDDGQPQNIDGYDQKDGKQRRFKQVKSVRW